MLGKTLAVGTLALALAAAASAGGRVTTVSLKLTIAGAGTVKVADKAPITCTSTCHRTLHIEKGSRVTLVSSTIGTLWEPGPWKLWKSGRWKGACLNTAPKCRVRMTRNRRPGRKGDRHDTRHDGRRHPSQQSPQDHDRVPPPTAEARQRGPA